MTAYALFFQKSKKRYIGFVHEKTILSSMVYENQTGFAKDRLITENFLLAQEIGHCIQEGKEGGNVVMKLDIFQACDKISWTFFTPVLRKLGFNEYFIEFYPQANIK